ncbi:MAG: LacI family DNA-binding transcriptional regulator [Pseudomonadota bacterium]
MSGKQAPRRATIVDVAKLAGLSIKTVSRVTNNEPNVRPAMRQRVLDAIAVLGYRPMQSARGLAARRSQLMALVYDIPNGNYLIRIQNGARQCCKEHGMQLLLHPCDHRSPLLAAELVKLASHLRLEGLVLAPPISLDDAVIAALENAHIPVALLAAVRTDRGTCAVRMDDEHGAKLLVEHIIGLGHRHIGFVRGHPDYESSRARLTAFRRAMKRAGLEVPEGSVIDGDFSFESGQRAAAALLDRDTPPTAIIACYDNTAAGVIAVAHDRGMAVPDELAVGAFGDTPLASMTWPPLTSVRQPLDDMAYAGTRLLIAHVRGERRVHPPSSLEFRLVVRESTVAAEAGA